jgi:hypothetical protein
MDGLTLLIFATSISYVLAVFLSDVVENEINNKEVNRRARR